MSAQKPKEPQYGDTVSLPTPDAACTPEQQRRRNGLRCVALFLRLRTAPRTGLRPRAGWLRLRAGGAHASRGLKARAPHGRRGPPAGGFGHPEHRAYSARPSGSLFGAHRRPVRLWSLWSLCRKNPVPNRNKIQHPRCPMRRLRARAEQRHSSHRRSGKAGHSVRLL